MEQERVWVQWEGVMHRMHSQQHDRVGWAWTMMMRMRVWRDGIEWRSKLRLTLPMLPPLHLSHVRRRVVADPLSLKCGAVDEINE